MQAHQNGAPTPDGTSFAASLRAAVSQRKSPAATLAADMPGLGDRPFKPCFMFFYGSLMDPEVVQTVLGLPEPPVMEKGLITGFKIRMWSIYLTLVPCAGFKVYGTVWKCEDCAPGPMSFHSVAEVYRHSRNSISIRRGLGRNSDRRSSHHTTLLGLLKSTLSDFRNPQ